MIVHHDVGRRETVQAANRDEPRIARAGANQIDDVSHLSQCQTQRLVDCRPSTLDSQSVVRHLRCADVPTVDR